MQHGGLYVVVTEDCEECKSTRGGSETQTKVEDGWSRSGREGGQGADNACQEDVGSGNSEETCAATDFVSYGLSSDSHPWVLTGKILARQCEKQRTERLEMPRSSSGSECARRTIVNVPHRSLQHFLLSLQQPQRSGNPDAQRLPNASGHVERW